MDVESKWYQQAAAIGEKHKVSLSFKPCAVYCCWFVFFLFIVFNCFGFVFCLFFWFVCFLVCFFAWLFFYLFFVF